jgi:hypothetical protein
MTLINWRSCWCCGGRNFRERLQTLLQSCKLVELCPQLQGREQTCPPRPRRGRRSRTASLVLPQQWLGQQRSKLDMETTSHRALHGGELGFWGGLNHGIPGWFASTMGFAGGNGLGNALKPNCACKN